LEAMERMQVHTSGLMVETAAVVVEVTEEAVGEHRLESL
jgi:hypothetical protein